MAELKTQRNNGNVAQFLESVETEQRRADAKQVLALMESITGHKPEMWGGSIIGFGSYHYTYASGREGDWMLTGFSPRKKSLTLYLMSGFSGMDELMVRLGKHKTGKGCLYINKLQDVDVEVLKELITTSIATIKNKYGSIDNS